MDTTAATISKLSEHQSATPSKWRENAGYVKKPDKLIIEKEADVASSKHRKS